MTLAAVMPTLIPSIWLASWAARSSQRSARAGVALNNVTAIAAGSASVASLRNSALGVIVVPLCAIEAFAKDRRKGRLLMIPRENTVRTEGDADGGFIRLTTRRSSGRRALVRHRQIS